jgi:hypothetical protein
LKVPALGFDKDDTAVLAGVRCEGKAGEKQDGKHRTQRTDGRTMKLRK